MFDQSLQGDSDEDEAAGDLDAMLADALAQLCGYLPLALRLAGSALANRRTLAPEEYVRRFEKAQTRLELPEKVEKSLSLSYDLLSEELQRAWCALAVFPSTFDIAAAAAVWDAEMEAAQVQLDELLRHSLVEWNEITARAHLHDLARLFEYPDKSYVQRCRDAGLNEFADEMANLTEPGIQELFISTFDWNPATSLDLGWHLYGDQYERGEFLALAVEHHESGPPRRVHHDVAPLGDPTNAGGTLWERTPSSPSTAMATALIRWGR